MLATMEQEPKQTETAETPEGIRCRRCGSTQSHVYYTDRQVGDKIKRYRECNDCGYRFRTHERIIGAGPV